MEAQARAAVEKAKADAEKIVNEVRAEVARERADMAEAETIVATERAKLKRVEQKIAVESAEAEQQSAAITEISMEGTRSEDRRR